MILLTSYIVEISIIFNKFALQFSETFDLNNMNIMENDSIKIFNVYINLKRDKTIIIKKRKQTTLRHINELRNRILAKYGVFVYFRYRNLTK